jgi:ComF family protein
MCAGCEEPLERDEGWFCGGCAVLLDHVAEAHRAPAADASVFVFAGPLAHAIRRFKYGARPDLARPLGEMLATGAAPLAAHISTVVPVPLHPSRLRARGFNQATLLARPVARALGVPLRAQGLRRTRATRAQAGLDAHDRADNVRGAFRAISMQGERVLVIDDVRTTGATLAAAAEALRAAGAREVRTLTLGRAA